MNTCSGRRDDCAGAACGNAGKYHAVITTVEYTQTRLRHADARESEPKNCIVAVRPTAMGPQKYKNEIRKDVDFRGNYLYLFIYVPRYRLDE